MGYPARSLGSRIPPEGLPKTIQTVDERSLKWGPRFPQPYAKEYAAKGRVRVREEPWRSVSYNEQSIQYGFCDTVLLLASPLRTGCSSLVGVE